MEMWGSQLPPINPQIASPSPLAPPFMASFVGARFSLAGAVRPQEPPQSSPRRTRVSAPNPIQPNPAHSSRAWLYPSFWQRVGNPLLGSPDPPHPMTLGPLRGAGRSHEVTVGTAVGTLPLGTLLDPRGLLFSPTQ